MTISLRKTIIATGASLVIGFGVSNASAHDRGHHYRDHHRHGHHGHHRGHRRHCERNNRVDYYQPALHAVPPVVYQQPPQVSYAQNYAPQSYYPTAGYPARPNFGNAVGGALGGLVGSTIGHGQGQLAATAAGAVMGYVIGGHVGNAYR